MTMTWQSDSWLDCVDLETIPVLVVGRPPEGVYQFANLAEAKRVFPELDPHRSTNKFTAAMRGEIDGAPGMRFETWEAYEVFSI